MNYEYEINKIKAQLQNLQEIVLRMSRSNTEEVSKREQTTAQVDSLTPYTETKTAYYGEMEKTFYDVPQGNVSVFFSNDVGRWYDVKRTNNMLTISFDALLEQTDITIMIQ